MEKKELITKKALLLKGMVGLGLSLEDCEEIVENIIDSTMEQMETESTEVLKQVFPLLDELILHTPTGNLRNKICDVNIQVQANLYGIEKIDYEKN